MILWLVNILHALHLASSATSYLMSDFEKTNSFMLSSNKINYDFEYINIRSSSKAFLSRVCLWHARSISCQVLFMLLQPMLKLEYISCTMDYEIRLYLRRFTKSYQMYCQNMNDSMLHKTLHALDVRKNILKWEKRIE